MAWGGLFQRAVVRLLWKLIINFVSRVFCIVFTGFLCCMLRFRWRDAQHADRKSSEWNQEVVRETAAAGCHWWVSTDNALHACSTSCVCTVLFLSPINLFVVFMICSEIQRCCRMLCVLTVCTLFSGKREPAIFLSSVNVFLPSFSVLTLLVGQQEWDPTCKNCCISRQRFSLTWP